MVSNIGGHTAEMLNLLSVLQKGVFTPRCTVVAPLMGGHTAEMLNLLSVLQKGVFTPRCTVVAATDG